MTKEPLNRSPKSDVENTVNGLLEHVDALVQILTTAKDDQRKSDFFADQIKDAEEIHDSLAKFIETEADEIDKGVLESEKMSIEIEKLRKIGNISVSVALLAPFVIYFVSGIESIYEKILIVLSGVFVALLSKLVWDISRLRLSIQDTKLQSAMFKATLAKFEHAKNILSQALENSKQS